MTPLDDYDIMIVGGGPAGISTWLNLHKYNPELASKTVLIEKEKYPRDKLCGGGLQKWMTQKIFDNLQIDLNIPFVSINNFEIRLGEDFYTHKEKDFFRVVKRIEFDQYLANIAIYRGLLIKENEKFLDLSYTSKGLLVKTSKTHYNIKILVGADGALSTVRRKMDLLKKPSLAPTIEIFAPVNPQFDPEFNNQSAVLDFTAINKGLQGYIWHFPCLKNGKPFMNHGICDFRILPNKKRANLKQLFCQELQSRNIPCDTKFWRSHPIPYFRDQGILSKSNIILVGDAAGIEPFLGGGIHLALTYGAVASKAISDAFKNKDFSFENYTQQIKDHYLGKYINKLTSIAKLVYLDNTKLISTAAQIIAYKP
jgi:flavin-dependent dehydrogenase